jgi:hypothetical protein
VAIYWSEDQYLEWCEDPTTPVWYKVGIGKGGKIPDGASGRVDEEGFGGDNEHRQAIGSPGGNVRAVYHGTEGATMLMLDSFQRSQAGAYPRTALPVFGLQGGNAVNSMSWKHLGCVCDEVTLSMDAPDASTMVELRWLTSAHKILSSAPTPSALYKAAPATPGIYRTMGGSVKLTVDGGGAAGYRVQSATATLSNNPIPDNSGDEYTPVTVDGEQLWFPKGFLPGNELVRCRVSLREPLNYDQFEGSGWSYYGVVWVFTDGTTPRTLTLGPFYADDDGCTFITDGMQVWGFDFAAKKNTANAWTLT